MEYLGESKEINKIINPLVSVCVPTFQHVEFIGKCLGSIVSQKTNFPFEVLIGEDDSTDGTRDICKQFAEDHPDKIRLFLRNSADKMVRNGKKVGRRNHLGLYKEARGKFVCICDGDDYWLSENKLQYQVDLMGKYPDSSICIGKTLVDKAPTNAPEWPDEIKVLNSDQLKKSLYMGHVSSWMLRNNMGEFVINKAAQNCPGLDLMLFNFYKRKGSIIQCPELLSFYRFNPNGSLRKLKPSQMRKKQFTVSWYLFRYIHQDPIFFLRSVLYFSKRIVVNMLKFKPEKVES